MNHFFFTIATISDILEEKNQTYWNNKTCVTVSIDISKYTSTMHTQSEIITI